MTRSLHRVHAHEKLYIVVQIVQLPAELISQHFYPVFHFSSRYIHFHILVIEVVLGTVLEFVDPIEEYLSSLILPVEKSIIDHIIISGGHRLVRWHLLVHAREAILLAVATGRSSFITLGFPCATLITRLQSVSKC